MIMKKIFTFIAAMLVAFAVNANVYNITPTSPNAGGDNIRKGIRDHINAGDTLVLAAGTYEEASSIELNKNVVIMAAEGVTPIVQLASGAYFKMMNNANSQIIGIKFNGAAHNTQYGIRPYDNTHTSVIVENCEFTGFTKNIITCDGKNHADSVIINNCYFHNNTRAAVYFAASDSSLSSFNCCDYVKVTNTTIANVSALSGAGAIDIRNNANNETGESTRLYIDRCTFYNILGYERAVHSLKSPLVTIKNSIFMQPSNQANYAIWAYGGAVNNCMTYQFAGNRDWDACPIYTACTENNPLLVDAANGDYHLSLGENSNNSPALRAGTNGTSLGDPRWWPDFNVRGTMNEWSATADQMEWDDAKHIYFKQLDLVAGTYQFKINHGEWAAGWDSGNIAGALGDVALSDASGNISMTTDGRPVIVYFDLANNVVWADYLYPKVMVVGNFTEPAWQGILMDDENALSCHITITVPEGRWEFKIIDNNVWYGANGDVDRTNCTDWTLFKEGDQGYDPSINTGLLADIPGDYVLTYTYATKKLDIVYPTSFTRNAANDNYQTLCVPFNASITNAEVYEIGGVANGAVTITPFDALLVAGKSYIVKPSGTMTITKVGDGQVSNPIFPSGTGLYGVLGQAYKYVYDTESAKAEPWIHNYVLTAADNLFHEVVAGGDVTINSTRAYLHVDVPYSAPSLRIIENATDIKNIEGNEAAVKFIQNGQLFIKKNGIVYDVTGAIVK